MDSGLWALVWAESLGLTPSVERLEQKLGMHLESLKGRRWVRWWAGNLELVLGIHLEDSMGSRSETGLESLKQGWLEIDWVRWWSPKGSWWEIGLGSRSVIEWGSWWARELG